MKANWKKTELKVEDLSLWDENPRFPDEYFNKTEVDLIQYYLTDEKRFQIKKFAKEITSEFDLPQVEKLTVFDYKNKNIVLEGNRRVAVYKLLINPLLALKEEDITFFTQLKEQVLISPNFSLEVNVTNDKESGLRLVDRKHKKGNNEIGWNEFEKRNDSVRRSKGTVQDIRRVELGKQVRILPLPKEITNKVLGPGYITTLYRILDSDPARIKLEYSVSGNGSLLVKDEKKFTSLLKVIVYNVYNKRSLGSKKNNVDSRNLNSQPQIEKYLKSISEKDVVKIDSEIKRNKKDYKKFLKNGKVATTSPLLPTCFVIMPLSGLDDVYKIIQVAWKNVFGKKALVYHQNDDGDKGGADLMDEKILRNIRNATAVVGVLSMGSKEQKLYDFIKKDDRKKVFEKVFPFNVNVALETGYALRCVDDNTVKLRDGFFIADDSDEVSAYEYAKANFFDMAHRDVTSYKKDKLNELQKKLTQHFKHFKKKIEQL